jgi:hypothetical protein
LERGKGDEVPLEKCPGCENDLRTADHVTIEFTDSNRPWEKTGHLDEEGFLIDPSGDVARGLHSATMCSECGEMLFNFEGVAEHQEDAEEPKGEFTVEEFRKLLADDREAAAEFIAIHKVEEWMNDGAYEVARCIKNWIVNGLNLGDDDTLVGLAESFLEDT